MKITDIIGARQDVFSVSDTATVHDTARYLREKEVRAVGVCNSAGKLIGVVSQADISDKVAAENKCPAWMRVSEIMSTSLITVRPETSIDEAIRLMDKHGFYHLLIVDDKERFHGMISVQDLLKVIASDEKARADMLESYIYPQR